MIKFLILLALTSSAGAATVHIDERTQFNEKVTISPGPNTQYPALELKSKEGDVLVRIAAHNWSNAKNNADGTQRQDLHEHFSIYVSDGEGGFVHGIDITVNNKKPQIHMQGDTVWKTKGARPVIQSVNGRFYAIVARETYERDEMTGNAILKYEMGLDPVDRSEIKWTHTTSRPAE